MAPVAEHEEVGLGVDELVLQVAGAVALVQEPPRVEVARVRIDGLVLVDPDHWDRNQCPCWDERPV